MTRAFDFQDLFVLDLANNHQGRVEHGLRIIRDVGEVVRHHGVRAVLKFQFRRLDTLIHPAHLRHSDNTHIPRFLSTRLALDAYRRLADEARQQELMTAATPFDEESGDDLLALDLDVLKVASSSATDWPLLEKVAECNKPVIFSTGGVSWKQIDDLVSFLEHRRVHFAIMHCVSLYPTPQDKLQLNRIALLRRRYPDTVIGFSTHEDPDDLVPVVAAVAKGARILERHVGAPADGITLNAYSSTPEQIDRWIEAALRARLVCGPDGHRPPAPEEIATLDALRRGVFTSRFVVQGATITRGDVYLAMPYLHGQLSAGEWKDGLVAARDLDKDDPVMLDAVLAPRDGDKQALFTAIHTVKAMLNEARIALPTEFETEFSHQYGIRDFPRVGVTIIDCINRTYCKKLIILMPGQRHPCHYHKRKEETFQVLYGVLEVEVENRRRTLHPGDTQLIQQGVWHEFWTETGAIVEEISTTHFNDDSFYEDKAINRVDRSVRKTRVNQWGRYQI